MCRNKFMLSSLSAAQFIHYLLSVLIESFQMQEWRVAAEFLFVICQTKKKKNMIQEDRTGEIINWTFCTTYIAHWWFLNMRLWNIWFGTLNQKVWIKMHTPLLQFLNIFKIIGQSTFIIVKYFQCSQIKKTVNNNPVFKAAKQEWIGNFPNYSMGMHFTIAFLVQKHETA